MNETIAAAAETFNRSRPHLIRVAYRMLGSVQDAEDMVQDAFVRWLKAERSDVLAPQAYLCRTVTRLCLDRLKSARHLRETYIGPWLPDPLLEQDDQEDVTLPLMLALERLSPLERAAFLLHDVFGQSFDDVAATIQREPAACRQLAARARAHVRDSRPRFKIEKQRGAALAEAFFAASRSGDMNGLRDLLAADVSLHADGGGKRPAAKRAIWGSAEVLKLHADLAHHFEEQPSTLIRTCFVNGLPGLVTREFDGELQTTAFDIEADKIVAIYIMRNPDKLRHLNS